MIPLSMAAQGGFNFPDASVAIGILTVCGILTGKPGKPEYLSQKKEGDETIKNIHSAL